MKNNSPSSWKSNLLLFVSSVIVVFLLLEVMIRSYDILKGDGFSSGRFNLLPKNVKSVQPFRTFGFELYKSVNGVKQISSRHGELYPLKKPNGTFRIVVFGGSTTENNRPFKEAKIHYPLVLQSKLRESLGSKAIEVINVAYSAYATPHSLILFELDVLSWKPDMIIVSHNINDLSAAYWPDLTFDYSNKYGNEFYSIPDYQSLFTTSNVLFQHSRLYWFVHGLVNDLNNKEGRNESTELQRKSYGNKPPQLAVEIFKRNLRSFVALAKENGIIVLLGNQPLQPSEELFVRHIDHKPYNSIVKYPLHNEFLHHHSAFNEVIRQVSEETGALFIDNESEFGGDIEYFIDYVHYTPKGVRRLADNYAEFIRSRNIIQFSEAL